jgi:uncharacterized protein (TIGR03435 family)
MAWTKTKTTVTAGLVVLTLGAVFAVWRMHHPPVSDSIFRMEYIGLQRAPGNVLILRPTHFAGSQRRGDVTYASDSQGGKPVLRVMGYKVSFAQVIATAYQGATNRVLLPPEAPTGDYDFLVTVPEQPNERLQAAIRKKLGWVAGWEPRPTEALALKIKAPDAPALHPSANGERTSISVQNGRLQATHVRLGFLAGPLGNALKQPIADQTDQSSYYDFSVDFDWNRFRNAPDRAMVDKMLGQLGLELRPDTISMPMLVVKKAR